MISEIFLISVFAIAIYALESLRFTRGVVVIVVATEARY
jgi:hypothetical protein